MNIQPSDIVFESVVTFDNLSNLEKTIYRKCMELGSILSEVLSLIMFKEDSGEDVYQDRCRTSPLWFQLKNYQRFWLINTWGLDPEWGIEELGYDYCPICSAGDFIKLLKCPKGRDRNKKSPKPLLIPILCEYGENGERWAYNGLPTKELNQRYTEKRINMFKEALEGNKQIEDIKDIEVAKKPISEYWSQSSQSEKTKKRRRSRVAKIKE
ncbi:MAG: hypothetical protein WA125_16625 [Desulfosporosinus sp.]